jgi:hypothetical protein
VAASVCVGVHVGVFECPRKSPNWYWIDTTAPPYLPHISTPLRVYTGLICESNNMKKIPLYAYTSPCVHALLQNNIPHNSTPHISILQSNILHSNIPNSIIQLSSTAHLLYTTQSLRTLDKEASRERPRATPKTT